MVHGAVLVGWLVHLCKHQTHHSTLAKPDGIHYSFCCRTQPKYKKSIIHKRKWGEKTVLSARGEKNQTQPVIFLWSTTTFLMQPRTTFRKRLMLDRMCAVVQCAPRASRAIKSKIVKILRDAICITYKILLII